MTELARLLFQELQLSYFRFFFYLAPARCAASAEGVKGSGDTGHIGQGSSAQAGALTGRTRGRMGLLRSLHSGLTTKAKCDSLLPVCLKMFSF